MIRVIIADDEALVRGGIRMLLSGLEDIEVVADAASGGEVLAQARGSRPDVILMDLKMPGTDGIEATRALTEDVADRDDPVVKVLVLTTFHDDASVYGALRAGASGFILKDNAPAHLVDAIRAVAGGASWLDPSVARQVIKALNDAPARETSSSELVARLTPREREVLSLMAQGHALSDIRGKLVVSDATVRTHVSRILMKTGARDRAQAVVLAYQSGLVRVGATQPSRHRPPG